MTFEGLDCGLVLILCADTNKARKSIIGFRAFLVAEPWFCGIPFLDYYGHRGGRKKMYAHEIYVPGVVEAELLHGADSMHRLRGSAHPRHQHQGEYVLRDNFQVYLCVYSLFMVSVFSSNIHPRSL